MATHALWTKRDGGETVRGRRGEAGSAYLAVYVTCKPRMLTLFLYVPLMRPLAAVLPSF